MVRSVVVTEADSGVGPVGVIELAAAGCEVVGTVRAEVVARAASDTGGQVLLGTDIWSAAKEGSFPGAAQRPRRGGLRPGAGRPQRSADQDPRPAMSRSLP